MPVNVFPKCLCVGKLFRHQVRMHGVKRNTAIVKLNAKIISTGPVNTLLPLMSCSLFC